MPSEEENSPLLEQDGPEVDDDDQVKNDVACRSKFIKWGLKIFNVVYLSI